MQRLFTSKLASSVHAKSITHLCVIILKKDIQGLRADVSYILCKVHCKIEMSALITFAKSTYLL